MKEKRTGWFRWRRGNRTERDLPPDQETARPTPEAPPPLTDLDALNPFREGGSPFRQAELALQAEERSEAQAEGHAGRPGAAEGNPTAGELRVRNRFRTLVEKVRAAAEDAARHVETVHRDARAKVDRLATEADLKRRDVHALAQREDDCQRLGAVRRKKRQAEENLFAFLRRNDMDPGRIPRPRRRWFWVWLVVVGIAETVMNGLLLHTASTEGFLVNWGFAVTVTALNVVLLAWLASVAISYLLHGQVRLLGKIAIGGGLALIGMVAVCLNFGFAHYRDVVVALADSEARAEGVDDIDAGATTDDSGHPPVEIPRGQAVLRELRTGFFLASGAPMNFYTHPIDAPPDDHERDIVETVPPERLGYRAENGRLWLTVDPRAGEIDTWRSLILCFVGLLALVLGVWKWYTREEPVPGFEERFRLVQDLDERGQAAYIEAIERAQVAEREHHQGLNRLEAGIGALRNRMEAATRVRSDILDRASDRAAKVRRAATGAVEEWRGLNVGARMAQEPPPEQWRTPWEMEGDHDVARVDRAWDRQHDRAVAETDAILERARKENEEHLPVATRAFADLRERLAHAIGVPRPYTAPAAGTETAGEPPTEPGDIPPDPPVSDEEADRRDLPSLRSVDGDFRRKRGVS